MGTNCMPFGSNLRLFTSHGTVMFVDRATGELRHGLLEHSPPNVLLVCEEEWARLRLIDVASQHDIACLSKYSAVVGSEKARDNGTITGSSFSCVPTSGKEFGLTQNGLFLSAEPDGRIALRAPHLKAWEMFHTRTDASELSGTIVSYRIEGLIIHFFITNRNDWIQYNQCRGDFYERDGLELIRLHCPPERAFVDIGANIGNHAVFVSKFCGVPDIIVFEPNPIAIRLLRINLSLNSCSNVDTHYLGLALGSEPKQLRVFDPSPDNLGGAQMIEDCQGDVKCIPGDEVLLQRPIGFIKIDVEGMEFDVLKGLRETILRWRPNIYIEVKHEAREALRAWCEKFGYDIRKALAWDNYLLLPLDGKTVRPPLSSNQSAQTSQQVKHVAETAKSASDLKFLDIVGEFRAVKSGGLSSPGTLCQLMTSFGSDKGAPFHNYTVVYDRLFARFRSKFLTIFELGLGTNKVGAPSSMGPQGKPGASLRGWRAYFPNAQIFGADIDANILFEEDRIRTFWVDQRDREAVRSLWHRLGDVTFDIMIDDGLHEASANISFFMESFSKLKCGGIYVIEDVTPQDVELIGSFITSVACMCKDVIFEGLEHPLNNVDNRLAIFHKA
jgi:FkbM family methyltransferase